MAHFAKIKKGKVVDLIVVANEDCGGGNFPESEPIGQEFIALLAKNHKRLEGNWVQTSYNTRNGLYYPGGAIIEEYEFQDIQGNVLTVEEMAQLEKDEIVHVLTYTNAETGKGFRLNFGQIGYTFDPNAGEHGEFYPPEDNEE
jgi:hypothetical protein